MTPHSKITPRSFNDVQVIADHFIAGRFVEINLQEADRELSRRIMDFASGLYYGSGGSMEKVDPQVYRMRPPRPPEVHQMAPLK